MRNSLPQSQPVTLTIAGSDSGGGAGIQADLQAIAATGAFGTSAITAVTAQNTQGVEDTHVLPPEQVQAQITAVLDDFDVDAIKTGMLATAEVIDAVADVVADYDIPMVVDPVMIAATGDRLLSEDAEDSYYTLFEHADIITPNADEAETLAKTHINDHDSAIEAGRELLESGTDAVLLKGGHIATDPVEDILITDTDVTVFTHPRVNTSASHGSGCALAASIAGRLSHGQDIHSAVDEATSFLGRAIRYHYDLGEGSGAVNHLVDLRNRATKTKTQSTVSSLVNEIAEISPRKLIPEVGMTVVGATPYAESVEDIAGVDGRINRTVSGISTDSGVRFGASSHASRFLLSAREYNPNLRFALNARYGSDVMTALTDTSWSIAEASPVETDDHQQRIQHLVDETFDESTSPNVVVDRGGMYSEPLCWLLTENPQPLKANLETLLALLN